MTILGVGSVIQPRSGPLKQTICGEVTLKS